MSDVPDFCPEGYYWEDCGHRAPLTVEERLHRAFEPSAPRPIWRTDDDR